MRVLDRYIGKTVLAGTLMALAALVSLQLFFTFLGEMADVGKGDYSIGEALIYVALTTPRRIQENMAYAMLLGSLFSLGALAAHSELVAIRAAGVSITRFIVGALKMGMAIMVVTALMGEFVAAPLEQVAQNRKAAKQSQSTIFRSSYGFWVRDGLSFINIRNIFPGGRLGGIVIYEFDENHRLRSAMQAKEAVYEGNGWRLKGIRQSVIGEDRVTVKSAKGAEWGSMLNPELISVVTIEPERLSALGLSRYIRYLRDNGLDPMRYEHALWGRLMAPFSGLVMLVLAVPFVFGMLRSGGAGRRLMVGALLGVTFHIFNQTFGHLGQIYSLHPAFTAAFPGLLFLGLAFGLLHRVR